MDKQVPYIVYESALSRMERQVKRLWIALIITIVLMFISNAIWVYEWCQYDYSAVEIDSNDGGNANYIGYSGGD